MNNNLILDFETLSVDVTKCISINCACLVFDTDRFSTKPYSFDELYGMTKIYKFDVKEQKALGWISDKNTIEFWMKQSEAAKQQLLPSKNDIDIDHFIDEITKISKDHNIKKWWSRGNNFDPVILKRMFDTKGLNLSDTLYHGNVRDIRTALDALTGFDNSFRDDFLPDTVDKALFVKHNSIHDICADVLRLQFFLGE